MMPRCPIFFNVFDKNDAELSCFIFHIFEKSDAELSWIFL